MTRNILASKPRVTRFKINWDDTNGNAGEEQIDGEAGTSETNQVGQGMEFDEMGDMNGEPQDENSLVMPPNENSNSLAMECWARVSDKSFFSNTFHVQFSFSCRTEQTLAECSQKGGENDFVNIDFQ